MYYKPCYDLVVRTDLEMCTKHSECELGESCFRAIAQPKQFFKKRRKKIYRKFTPSHTGEQCLFYTPYNKVGAGNAYKDTQELIDFYKKSEEEEK